MEFKDRERAVALLKDVQSHGGRATLGEATIRFDRIPSPFDQILSEVDGVVSVFAERPIESCAATIRADTDEGSATLDVDLATAQPEADWDAKLIGQRNGLTVELRFVWRHDPANGSIGLTWRLTRATGSAHERAQALALIVALHGKGTFAIADREERRPTMSEPTVSRPVPAGLRALRDVYQDLADIQAFAGKTFGPPPDDFSADDAYNVSYLAHLLRLGRIDSNVTSVRMIVDAEGLAQFRPLGNDIEVREDLIANLFGREVHVAERVLHLPPMKVRYASGPAEGQWEVELVPVSGDQAPMEIEFRRP